MKYLLAAINAKYIHSNLGVYCLRAYAEERLKSLDQGLTPVIEIGEYTINHPMEHILMDIYKRKPDVIGFSCYIWNITSVLGLVRDLHKVLPKVEIWLGGPEATYDAKKLMEQEQDLAGIMVGEGEETFASLVLEYEYSRLPVKKAEAQEDMVVPAGVVMRDGSGSLIAGNSRPLLPMDSLPFPYKGLESFQNRIIYYESSRGCPFSCSYCLSSIDKSVRFRSVDLVKQELSFFLENQVQQVKFVDRTFNCKKSHALEIWRYIQEHDNGVTNFHFEISADLLGEEELSVLKQMRPGLIQLEIGVQSTNPDVIREIHRTMDLNRLKAVVDRINRFGNIHQHLDLIAGLPFEDMASFQRSFHEVYGMKPDQLQLGFLKVLKGSYMADKAAEYGIQYKSQPNYEVLSTRWIGYGDVLRLKAVEEMVEVYYNSRQFSYTLEKLVQRFPSPFAMFEAMADDYDRKQLSGMNHSRLARFEILYEFIKDTCPGDLKSFQDLLVFDLYLRENSKSRPYFAPDQSPYKAKIRDFFIREAASPLYLTGYEGYDSKQISRMAHIEVMESGRWILFDYRNRDKLSHNARAVDLTAIFD